MSQNGSNSDNNSNDKSPTVSWGTKAGYIGTGVLIGLVAYPFVRKVLAKVQPKADRFLDELTGKAENLAEKASDLLAKAKEGWNKESLDHAEDSHDHKHS